MLARQSIFSTFQGARRFFSTKNREDTWLSLKLRQPARQMATYPLPPDYDWEKVQLAKPLPHEHEHLLDNATLPEGLTFSALNPLFLGMAGSQIAELYELMGSQQFNHPIQRHLQQLIVFNPKRRALHSLAAHVASEVCIYNDDHFVEVCEKLYPEVLSHYDDRQILLSEQADKCREEARRFMNCYLYAYDDSNPLHRQVKFIEHEMRARQEELGGSFDQMRLYKAIIILIQSKTYKQNVYPAVEESVRSTIKKHLTTSPIHLIPDDVRGSDELWALPVKPANERHNHIVVGGSASGKSASIAQFAARYKQETGKTGLMVTATLNVDWVRALIKLEDIVLADNIGNTDHAHLKQAWGPLSHMEASIMNQMALELVDERLHREGVAPEIFHETTFPDEEVVNLFMSKGGKLFLYLTNYDPIKAVDGNLNRFKNTGRFVPIETVLGSQQYASSMLLDLLHKRSNTEIVIEHHNTQEIAHNPNATELGIGLIDLKKNLYNIFDIDRTVSLVKSLHINKDATTREQVFPNSDAISAEALTRQFIEEVGGMDLVFFGPSEKQAPGEKTAYASFSKETGLIVHDLVAYEQMSAKSPLSVELFNHLRNLTNNLYSSVTLSSKF